MSDLTDTVEAIFIKYGTDPVRLAAEDGTWPQDLWRAVEDAGLPLALVDTGPAALGLSVTDAFDIARLTGAHSVPIPLVETMLANWLLARCGQTIRPGPVTLATGSSRGVPWGRRAAVVQAAEEGIMFHAPAEVRILRQAGNIAREPRDDLEVPPGRTRSPYPQPLTAGAIEAAIAALRTAQIAGAIDWITRAAVDYAKTRVQFGKPIGKFQAIQHSLAQLAEQAAGSAAAADMAAEAFARDIDRTAIAAAKCFASEAAGTAAGLAHQIHGAIGFSREFALHHRTRRLWSWRDEAGNEAHWSAVLGRQLAGKPRAEVWHALTTL